MIPSAELNARAQTHADDAETLERDEAGLITTVRLKRPFRQPYGRIEVAGADGTKAWTSPLWIA